ncbi:tRNA (guanosine(37)-N1)-methyltransferase TrmD [Candidatus Parcubacteria bacterium]|nr:tRNA (guanosine(37)-N1)-methyltransferase TrmD [Candidatus Parcubacteria bacterium]
MKFDIITIFPEIFDSYLKESLISRARKKKLLKINIYNLRKYTKDAHKTVDDRPFGGGLGMVFKVEPIFKAVTALKRKAKSEKRKTKIILFTPRGKQFNQKMAYQFSKLDHLIMICGRYEGVDERVAKHIADIELSIGPYDLMGGELPAMVVIETMARLIPGIIGKPELLKQRIPIKRGRQGRGFIEYPQYTRPPKFFVKKLRRARPEVWQVPKVLLSGNHKKIQEWRQKHQKIIEK